jgi:hypothetical protein
MEKAANKKGLTGFAFLVLFIIASQSRDMIEVAFLLVFCPSLKMAQVAPGTLWPS